MCTLYIFDSTSKKWIWRASFRKNKLQKNSIFGYSLVISFTRNVSRIRAVILALGYLICKLFNSLSWISSHNTKFLFIFYSASHPHRISIPFTLAISSFIFFSMFFFRSLHFGLKFQCEQEIKIVFRCQWNNVKESQQLETFPNGLSLHYYPFNQKVTVQPKTNKFYKTMKKPNERINISFHSPCIHK